MAARSAAERKSIASIAGNIRASRSNGVDMLAAANAAKERDYRLGHTNCPLCPDNPPIDQSLPAEVITRKATNLRVAHMGRMRRLRQKRDTLTVKLEAAESGNVVAAE
jgi:hypothetical protein